MTIYRTLVPALALAMFTTACARHEHHQARAPKARPVVADAGPVEVTVAKPASTPAAPAQKFGAFKIYQESGENQGKCTPGVVATFAWHKNNRPRLEGEIQNAIDALEAAKKSNQGVDEAGQNLRRVYDLNMKTISTIEQNYGTFACEVPGTQKTVIGSDQIAGNLAKIKAYVANEPAVPAPAKK